MVSSLHLPASLDARSIAIPGRHPAASHHSSSRLLTHVLRAGRYDWTDACGSLRKHVLKPMISSQCLNTPGISTCTAGLMQLLYIILLVLKPPCPSRTSSLASLGWLATTRYPFVEHPGYAISFSTFLYVSRNVSFPVLLRFSLSPPSPLPGFFSALFVLPFQSPPELSLIPASSLPQRLCPLLSSPLVRLEYVNPYLSAIQLTVWLLLFNDFLCPTCSLEHLDSPVTRSIMNNYGIYDPALAQQHQQFLANQQQLLAHQQQQLLGDAQTFSGPPPLYYSPGACGPPTFPNQFPPNLAPYGPPNAYPLASGFPGQADQAFELDAMKVSVLISGSRLTEQRALDTSSLPVNPVNGMQPQIDSSSSFDNMPPKRARLGGDSPGLAAGAQPFTPGAVTPYVSNGSFVPDGGHNQSPLYLGGPLSTPSQTPHMGRMGGLAVPQTPFMSMVNGMNGMMPMGNMAMSPAFPYGMGMVRPRERCL